MIIDRNLQDKIEEWDRYGSRHLIDTLRYKCRQSGINEAHCNRDHRLDMEIEALEKMILSRSTTPEIIKLKIN